MLKKPYLLINSQENMNYYILQAGDQFYLTTESVVKYRKGKKEHTITVTQLPLASFVIMLLTKFVTLPHVDINGEDIFEPLQVKEIKKVMADFDRQVHKDGSKKSVFSYTKSTHNPFLKGFMDENNLEVVCVEDIDSRSRNIWMAKATKYGSLTIYIASVFGKPEKESVIDMKRYILNQETATALLNKFGGITSKKEVE